VAGCCEGGNEPSVFTKWGDGGSCLAEELLLS